MLKLMVMIPLAWMTVLLIDGGEGSDGVTAHVGSQSLRRITCKVHPPPPAQSVMGEVILTRSVTSLHTGSEGGAQRRSGTASTWGLKLHDNVEQALVQAASSLQSCPLKSPGDMFLHGAASLQASLVAMAQTP